MTQARARAQRTKLDVQTQEKQELAHSPAEEKPHVSAKNRKNVTVARAIQDYIDDHEGGNHSDKTIEWHQTALGLLQTYLQHEREITVITGIDAPDISAWFASMRKTPGARGKIRSERTIQTYARSARAFFHWLVRQNLLAENPFDRVVFPKVGRPLIQTITDEEFEKLLLACAPPNEEGRFAERAAVRNRAILWLFYDTGIRVSELTHLRLADFDRKKGMITVKGKGSKERRIALGQNCLRNVLQYVDRHRPDEKELEEWGSLWGGSSLPRRNEATIDEKWHYLTVCSLEKANRNYGETDQSTHFSSHVCDPLPHFGQRSVQLAGFAWA